MRHDTPKCLVCVLFAYFFPLIICIARNLSNLPKTINTALLWMKALLLNEVQLEKTSLCLEEFTDLCRIYLAVLPHEITFEIMFESEAAVHVFCTFRHTLNGTADDWNCAVCLIKKSHQNLYVKKESIFASERWWRSYFPHEFALRQDVQIILVTGSWFLKRAGIFD